MWRDISAALLGNAPPPEQEEGLGALRGAFSHLTASSTQGQSTGSNRQAEIKVNSSNFYSTSKGFGSSDLYENRRGGESKQSAERQERFTASATTVAAASVKLKPQSTQPTQSTQSTQPTQPTRTNVQPEASRPRQPQKNIQITCKRAKNERKWDRKTKSNSGISG